MIHIIGTDHSKTQFWSDAIRRDASLDTCAAIVERFEAYLRGAATSLKASVISEEMSKERVVLMGSGALSVAKKVAEELGLRHAYCDPDLEERRCIHSKDREPIWMACIQPFSP